MKKRFFLLLICLLTLTVSICLFSSCDDDGKNDGDGTTDGGKEPCTHSYTSSVTKEAGCETEGTLTYTCSLCGESYTETVSAKGHTPVTDARKEPTYTETGLTEGSHCSVCNKVLVTQNTISMLPSKTEFTSKSLTVSDIILSGSFSYATDNFSFAEDITVANNSLWSVSTDSQGTQNVENKTVPLSEGNNTFYIHITNLDQSVTTYTVNIYRNHMYTVTFDTKGGTAVAPQNIEEGFKATVPEATTRAGYTFAGWDYDFDTPITDNTEIAASWTANTDTKYTVECYVENLSKTGYDLDSTKTPSATTGYQIVLSPTNKNGFTLDMDKSELSGIVAGDGSLVLKVYYTRNTYTINTAATAGGTVSGGGTYAYGKEITLTAITKPGYKFDGWYQNGSPFSSSEICDVYVSSDKNFEARWTANKNTLYTVEYYLENVTGDGYDLITDETEELFGTTDTTASAEEKVFEHFVIDTEKSILSGNISGDGALVLKVYYMRTYTVKTSISNIKGGTVTEINGEYPYGTEIKLTVTVNAGYTFNGYFVGSDIVCDTLEYTFTVEENRDIVVNVTANSGIPYRVEYYLENGNKNGYILITDETEELFGTTDTTVNAEEKVFEHFVIDTEKSILSGNISGDGALVLKVYYTNSVIDALAFEKIGTTGYKIKSYTGNANYLILPGTYDGLPVTEIANNVFKDRSFIYLHMPDSITTLGVAAFMNCKNLKEIYLSSNLTTIGASAFNGCTALETISLPDTITAIPATCFFGCTSLKDIKLGSNITSIGALAFRNCSSLDKLHIPKTVQTITAAAPAQAPFLGTAENFMLVLEDTKAADGFSQYFTLISTDPTANALVIYNQTYEQFITNHAELRKADVTTALADSIIVGSTPISGFESNKFEYNTFANINYSYPNVSIIVASPAALVTITQPTAANGGVATINIVSADGLSENTYTVNFNLSGEFAASTEIVNKNGADGVVTYVLDDGFEPTATFAKTMLQKYDFLSLSFATWTRDFATLTEQTDSDGKKSYVMDNGKYVYTRNEAKINFWNDILSGVEGRAEILSHSHTHRPWGMNDDGGEYKYVANNGTVQTATTPKGSSSKEYYAAKQIIKDIFPQFKNLLFITPGIGVKGSDQTVNGELIVGYSHFANQVLENCIKNNVYLGARGTFSAGTNYTSRVVTKDTIKNLSTRMQLPGLMVKYEDDVTSWTNYIDKAAEMGGWAMFCIHAIEVAGESQGNWVIPQDKAEQLFAYTKDKNIWVATGSEALSYYVEWATAKVDAKYDITTNKIAVTLTDEEEANDVFNTALTIKVSVPFLWESVKHGNKTLEIRTDADGSKYVYVDIVPDTGTVYLEMSAE